MKKKSKLSIQKTVAAKRENHPSNWLYLSEKEIALRNIQSVFAEDDSMQVEIWEEVEVLELALPCGRSVDIEKADITHCDEITEAYLKEHKIQCVYLITIVPDYYRESEAALKKIAQTLGGYYCADTQDFQPEIRPE